jgi:hypothetical protein
LAIARVTAMRAASALDFPSSAASSAVVVAQLDAEHDRPTLVFSQPLQRRIVPINGLRAHDCVEWRGAVRGRVLGDLETLRAAACAPIRIDDSIVHGPAQVHEEGSVRADLERVQMPQGADHRVLDEISRVHHGAG